MADATNNDELMSGLMNNVMAGIGGLNNDEAKHGRLLKLLFVNPDRHQTIEVAKIKFFGALSDPEVGEENDNPFEYEWEEMEDENENEFEALEHAKDITSSPLIKIVETYPKSEDISNLKNILTKSPFEFWSCERISKESKKDIWITFDMGAVKIDSFDISFYGYEDNVKTLAAIKVFTSKTNTTDDCEWQIIKIKRNVQENEKRSFYLKSKHQRYIKIAMDAYEIHMSNIKWKGMEPVIEDEITDKIKIYQSSGKMQDIHSNFMSEAGSKSWLIFDCKRYELDRMSIQFGKKSKPKMIKLRLSDVAPRYSFEQVTPANKWILQTSEVWEDKSWSEIELFEELLFSGNEYNDGFKRYLQLECSQYVADKMNIEKIRFYGKISQQIADGDEQFDSVLDVEHADDYEEKKVDDLDSKAEPYQFKIIDHSPTMQGPIENVWNKTGHEFWMSQPGVSPFVVLDLGNNPVDEICVKQFSMSFGGAAAMMPTFTTCKISSGDNLNKWTLIHEDNKMDLSDPAGSRYNISGKIKKYLKLEFLVGEMAGGMGMNPMMASMAMFALSSLQLFGNSIFLESVEKEITMDDIRNMKHVDEDLIHLYKKQEREKLDAGMLTYGMEVHKQTLTKLSDEWMEVQIKLYNTQALYSYMFTEIDAYQKATEFEKEETLKIAKMQKELAQKYVKEKMIENDIGHWKKYIVMEEEHKTAKELLDNTTDFEKKELLKKEVDDKFEVMGTEIMAWTTKTSTYHKELGDKITDLYGDDRNETIYKLWKDAVENHPTQISNAFNVYEYTQCLEKYARMTRYDEYKALLGKLADLFDKSMQEKSQLLHKFFVFQLSEYYDDIRGATFGLKPAVLLFDVGEAYEGKIHRIEFEMDRFCDMNTISIYTANELREEKVDNKDDEDESQLDYANFNLIGKLEFNEKVKASKREGVSFKDAQIILNYKNQRFIKAEFFDFDDTHSVRFTIKNVRFYIKEDDDEIKDDDEKENGPQLEKYKLNYVDGTIDHDDRDGIASAYKLNDAQTEISHKDKLAYLIFDCESRKVDKIELRFENTFEDHSFDKMCVSSSNTLDEDEDEKDMDEKEDDMVTNMKQQMMTNMMSTMMSGMDNTQSQMMQNMMMNAMNDGGDDDDDEKEENKKWSILFNDENGCSEYNKKDIKEAKTIFINGKNEKYLKLSFNLSENTKYLRLSHLKFYTTDPDDEYKWDIDENIKNLTSKIKLITAKPCNAKYKAENVLDPHSFKASSGYHVQLEKINHKELIEDKIRDEVCRGVNLLRKSRGGQISSHDKHFIKFLLCFQNERHYSEMLASSKLVMNILRKPLDIEYKRLQSINSEILILKVNKNNKCDGEIKSNHKLLEWDYNKWYIPRNAMFWDKDLKYLADEWTKLGLNLLDPEFKQLRRKSILETQKSFVSAEDLAQEYLNLLAHKINPSFQVAMRQLFKQNRKILNLVFPITDNKDLGVQSGPVKTKARQKIKVDLKYYSHPAPQCMAVLDIVRCAIVCEDDKELCSLFALIINQYSGSILRVKNAFDDIQKGEASHGYRAVMINMAFGGNNASLPNGYKMVCEVQLLLNKYYQVRKNMHLGYGVTRSEDGGLAENKQPYKVLARDSCKFGKLDI